MRSFLTTGVVVLLIVALRSLSFGQSTLTLEQCLAKARANGPALRIAENAVRMAELSKRELSTTARPQLKTAIGAGYAPFSRHFGYDPALSNGGQLTGQLMAEQIIYDGGRRSVKATQFDLDIARSGKERQLAVRDLEFGVRQAYVGVLKAQAEVSLREQTLMQLADYLELVARLNAGGAVAYTDLLKTRVELSTASISAAQARQSVTLAKYDLAELMGKPEDTSFNLSGSLDAYPIGQFDVIDAHMPFDSSQNLELAVARLNCERSVTEIREAERDRLPTVSLVGDAGLLTSRENLQLPHAERFRSIGYSVGFSLDLPLFDWGGRRFRVQQRQLAAESAMLQSEALRRSIAAEYRKSQLQLISATSQLDSLRANIKVAEDNFLLTKSKYAGGAALASEVLSAQQFLAETKISELETLAEMQILLARLEQIAAH